MVYEMLMRKGTCFLLSELVHNRSQYRFRAKTSGFSVACLYKERLTVIYYVYYVNYYVFYAVLDTLFHDIFRG